VTVTRKGLVSPPQYEGAVQPLDLIEAQGWGAPFAAGNVIKYLARYQRKEGMADLLKARWYLDWLIAHLKKEGRSE